MKLSTKNANYSEELKYNKSEIGDEIDGEKN